jgi:hypothetical protein
METEGLTPKDDAGRKRRSGRLRAEGGGPTEAPGTEAEVCGDGTRTAGGKRPTAGGRRQPRTCRKRA